MAVRWKNPKAAAKEAEKKYETLNNLLLQFGLNNITREVFWGHMNQNGYTQADIDAWCETYYAREQEKEDAKQEAKRQQEGRYGSARATASRDARGESRSEPQEDRPYRQASEQGGETETKWKGKMMNEAAEEDRFQKAIPASMKAVYAVDAYLKRKKYDTIVKVATARRNRTAEEIAQARDEEDIKARKKGETGDWRRFEVKGRGAEFTCAEDYPFPALMVDRANKDTPIADWYFITSKDLQYAAYVKGDTKDKWFVKNIFDTTRGYEGPVYFCDLSLATFIKIAE